MYLWFYICEIRVFIVLFFTDSAGPELELIPRFNPRHFSPDVDTGSKIKTTSSANGKRAPSDFDDLLQQAKAGISMQQPTAERNRRLQKWPKLDSSTRRYLRSSKCYGYKNKKLPLKARKNKKELLLQKACKLEKDLIQVYEDNPNLWKA